LGIVGHHFFDALDGMKRDEQRLGKVERFDLRLERSPVTCIPDFGDRPEDGADQRPDAPGAPEQGRLDAGVDVAAEIHRARYSMRMAGESNSRLSEYTTSLVMMKLAEPLLARRCRGWDKSVEHGANTPNTGISQSRPSRSVTLPPPCQLPHVGVGVGHGEPAVMVPSSRLVPCERSATSGPRLELSTRSQRRNRCPPRDGN